MAMGNCCPRFKSFMFAFDLFSDAYCTAGLFSLVGSEPVMATQMMQGLVMDISSFYKIAGKFNSCSLAQSNAMSYPASA
jgi:hypothetical protein